MDIRREGVVRVRGRDREGEDTVGKEGKLGVQRLR
jgi:hypothetical protein